MFAGSTAESQQLNLVDAPLFLTQNPPPLNLLVLGRDHKLYYEAYNDYGTGSVEWEWLPILKQSLIQTPVQFSRDPYVVEIPGRMGICMPYVIYPINASRVFVRELFYIQIA
jgi:hypothetical protein